MKMLNKASNPLSLVLAGAIGIAACVDAIAQTTFNVGATSTGSNTAVLWFKPTAAVTWTDAHYVASAGQENVRMTYNATLGRWEQVINAAAGQTVLANFTYLLNNAGYNSSNDLKPVVVAGNTASSSVASSVATSSIASSPASSAAAAVTANTVDNGSSVVIWLKPSGQTLGWVDVHYTLNNGGQQNFRMVYNAGTGRYEQSVAVAAGAAVDLSYRFTYEAPAGVTENAGGRYIRSATSSSSVSSSTAVVSSSSSKSSSAIAATTGAELLGPTSLKFTVNNAVMADVHFTVNGLRQDLRMTHNADNSNVYVATGLPAGARVDFYFTVGATDTVHLIDIGHDHYIMPAASSSTSSSVASSSTSSSSVTSSTSSVVSSASSSSAVSGDYNVSLTEFGSNLTIAFKTHLPQSKVTLHYTIDKGAQSNPAMGYNAATGAWEFQLRNLNPGELIDYGFTYNAAVGPFDSPWDDYVFGKSIGAIPQPTLNPAPGVYTTDQTVTLNTESGASIYYTTDGSMPTPGTAKLYSAAEPIRVTAGHGVWIQAIAVNAKGQSSVVEGAYSVDPAATGLAAPTFSHPSGNYNTIIRVTLAQPIEGATLYYTLDGSIPTTKSIQYTKAIELMIHETNAPDGNYQIKAIAVKKGVSSPVATATYKVTDNKKTTWNGKTTFKIVNNSKGKWRDDQVYWAIVGKEWGPVDSALRFLWVDATGKQVLMSLNDNDGPNHLTKDGKNFTNYFHKLSEVPEVTIDAINSARLMVSYGEPMYIQTNVDINGKLGYAGANVEDDYDPNVDVIFDFMEFAIVPNSSDYRGIFINNTRVDMFGYPVQVSVEGEDGFKQTVGESFRETREEIFARFKAEATPEFAKLIKAYDPKSPPARIMAPAHDKHTFGEEGVYKDYFKDYIDLVWATWRAKPITIKLDNGWVFTGQVKGDVFEFTDGLGVYKINGKPNTQEALLGNGLLDDQSGHAWQSLPAQKQLQIQAQICAAINRHVAHLDPSVWRDHTYFFPAGEVANWYDKLSRDHSLASLSYGFAYSDVGDQSSSIFTWSPKTVTFTVGW